MSMPKHVPYSMAFLVQDTSLRLFAGLPTLGGKLERKARPNDRRSTHDAQLSLSNALPNTR